MLDLKAAIAILAEKFPDKKVYGNPVEYKGGYAFSLVPKDQGESEPNYDSTITMVDRTSGEISQFSAFENLDFCTNAKPIKRES